MPAVVAPAIVMLSRTDTAPADAETKLDRQLMQSCVEPQLHSMTELVR